MAQAYHPWLVQVWFGGTSQIPRDKLAGDQQSGLRTRSMDSIKRAYHIEHAFRFPKISKETKDIIS